MLCKICSQQRPLDSDGYCQECATRIGHYNDKIHDLIMEGHTEHCAQRQVYGDGECECGMAPLTISTGRQQWFCSAEDVMITQMRNLLGAYLRHCDRPRRYYCLIRYEDYGNRVRIMLYSPFYWVGLCAEQSFKVPGPSFTVRQEFDMEWRSWVTEFMKSREILFRKFNSVCTIRYPDSILGYCRDLDERIAAALSGTAPNVIYGRSQDGFNQRRTPQTLPEDDCYEDDQ